MWLYGSYAKLVEGEDIMNGEMFKNLTQDLRKTIYKHISSYGHYIFSRKNISLEATTFIFENIKTCQKKILTGFILQTKFIHREFFCFRPTC